VAYLKPNSFTQLANKLVQVLRVKPVLTVVGRKSGQPRSVPVNVLEDDGKRYLVSPRGETEWVRNLRVAGEAELRTRKRTEQIGVSEVGDEAKPGLIDAYRARWERETKSFWTALPDPADHPIFEIR
jgi:deazaflavin-dependent oxidoreductase (nitroreductase family)